MRADDLTQFLTPDPTPAGNVTFRQGVVRTWDSSTGENTVVVAGTALTNLPMVISSAEIRTIVPGNVVGIQVVGVSWYIIGRVATPPFTPRGALDVLAGQTLADTVATNESYSTTTYGNLATVGPTVANVTIGTSGKALVTVAASMSTITGFELGYMGVDISGATTVAPTTAGKSLSLVCNSGPGGQVAFQYLQTALNAGVHQFQAKYRTLNGGVALFFANRTLSVVAL